MGPLWDFLNSRLWKCFYKISEIRWSWHFKYWNTAVFSKPTVIKWILNSKLLQRCVVYSTSSWTCYCVCDVIIARSCGTLPAFAAIIMAFSPWRCRMATFILCEIKHLQAKHIFGTVFRNMRVIFFAVQTAQSTMWTSICIASSAACIDLAYPWKIFCKPACLRCL